MSDAPETKSGITMGDLRNLISSMTAAPSGATTSETVSQPPDITAQVKAEIAKIEARKAREAKDAKTDETLKELQKRTEQKMPVERGFFHRFMGWGENE